MAFSTCPKAELVEAVGLLKWRSTLTAPQGVVPGARWRSPLCEWHLRTRSRRQRLLGAIQRRRATQREGLARRIAPAAAADLVGAVNALAGRWMAAVFCADASAAPALTTSIGTVAALRWTADCGRVHVLNCA